MDSDTLKILLSTQEQSYRSALEIFLKQVTTKVDSLQETVTDLTKSLEFSQKEIDDLKKQIFELKKGKESDEDTIKKLTLDLQADSKVIKDLEERCNYQEDYSRRNNLQIVGLKEDRVGETWEQTAIQVSKLLEEKMELPNIQLERAHRVGRGIDNGPRPVIVRFSRFCDREAARRNANKLKGTNIFINEDLCKASQEIKKAKLPLLRQARDEGKIAYFSHTKLIIKEKPSVPPSHKGGSAPPSTGVAWGKDSEVDSVEHGSVTGEGVVAGASGLAPDNKKRLQPPRKNKK